MGFPFVYICDLLQKLEDNAARGRRSSISGSGVIKDWFNAHKERLRDGEVDICAVVSTLVPTSRPGRVYGIQERTLGRTVSRALCLGRSRVAELLEYQTPGRGLDFAECVERALQQTPNPPHPPVTVEEIDAVLHDIASRCRFSSSVVRSSAARAPDATDQEAPLRRLYRRLEPNQAKWLSRLVLKDFSPVSLDPAIVYRHIDPLLPTLLKIHDDILVATNILTQHRAEYGFLSGASSASELSRRLVPVLGVKVGRQPFIKGRSIKHCSEMLYGRRVSVEKKLDGEYCQIHVDLSKGTDCIKIFSKSGKESTADRINAHYAIKSALDIDEPSCRFKKGCILEGELVVFSTRDDKILPFEKIRKHVSRSGSFFNRSKLDSQTHYWESLMIVYYDVLMIDDESLLGMRQSERCRRLGELVECKPGLSALVPRQVIDFTKRSAASDLRQALARCITAREEGLVLKPDDPYFDFSLGGHRRPYSCCSIKVKKEYIGNFGDVGDFAVVGARYDAAKAKTCKVPNLRWTHFYIGCLSNKEEVLRSTEKPSFTVTNVVELNASQLEYFAQYISPNTVSEEDNNFTILHFEPGLDDGKRPSIIFPEPPVFDIRCFSFIQEPNVAFSSLRFPMVSKIHCDRTWKNTVTFDELQRMAQKGKETPQPEDIQELLHWIAALEGADPKGVLVDASSQATTCSSRQTEPSQASSLALMSLHQPQPLPPPPLPVPQLKAPLTPDPTARSSPSSAAKSARRQTPSKRTSTLPADATVIDLTLSPPMNRRKRPADSPHLSSVERAKAQRTSPKDSSMTRSPLKAPYRGPLEDITISSSPRDNSQSFRLSFHEQPLTHGPSEQEKPFSRASPKRRPDRPPAVDSRTPPTSSIPVESPSRKTTTTVTKAGPSSSAPSQAALSKATKPPCYHRGTYSLLANKSILLSPCIATFPYVTDDLLREYGIATFETDLSRWDRSFLLPSNPTPKPARRPTKSRSPFSSDHIILVEAQRKDATGEFLDRVEELAKARLATAADPRQGRIYAEAYDWRLLEDVLRIEKKKKLRGDGRGHTGDEADATAEEEWWDEWRELKRRRGVGLVIINSC